MTAWLPLFGVLIGAGISVAGQWLLYRSQATVRLQELREERRERARDRLMPYILMVAAATIAMDDALLAISQHTEAEIASACEPLQPILPVLTIDPDLRQIGLALRDLGWQLRLSHDDLQRAWQGYSEADIEIYRTAVQAKLQPLKMALGEAAERLSV